MEWVAVKVFKPLAQCSLKTLEYLKREVVCQRRLSHVHVIGFREVGLTTDLRLYLALEWADSGSLRQWLDARGGRLPEADARWFAQQLVYGLEYCHAHGVFNRDVKPENLLLHSSGMERPLLKVADFGLCKSSADSAPNTVVGSPNYMAPEVFETKEYDGAKADVFSCGIVLYEMVFGCLPFSRTLDGRPLTAARHLPAMLSAMRQELWPHLLPTRPPGTHTAPATAPHAAPNPSTTAGNGTAPTHGAAANGQSGGGGGNGGNGGGGGGGPALLVQPSEGLMDLLASMLRHDPRARASLRDVKRHPWYAQGLPQHVYDMLLADQTGSTAADDEDSSTTDGSTAGGGGGAPRRQAVAVIEAEFGRIMAHCAAQREAAAAAALEAELGED